MMLVGQVVMLFSSLTDCFLLFHLPKLLWACTHHVLICTISPTLGGYWPVLTVYSKLPQFWIALVSAEQGHQHTLLFWWQWWYTVSYPDVWALVWGYGNNRPACQPVKLKNLETCTVDMNIHYILIAGIPVVRYQLSVSPSATHATV